MRKFHNFTKKSRKISYYIQDRIIRNNFSDAHLGRFDVGNAEISENLNFLGSDNQKSENVWLKMFD